MVEQEDHWQACEMAAIFLSLLRALRDTGVANRRRWDRYRPSILFSFRSASREILGQ
jgi:hypothetical protein